MADGLLLSLPTESIAVRVVVASLAAVLLGRLLLRAGLRVPGVRATAALIPAAALIAVVGLYSGQWRLPALMLPVEAVDALPIPMRNGYLHFAPIAAPLLASAWGAVALVGIGRRLLGVRAARGRALAGCRNREVPARVQRLVRRLAVQVHICPPPVALSDEVAGGATVVGIRRPLIVLDRRLAADLDRRELEGVLAHELAHVTRRDNLVALLVGIVRDLTFFVPGGRWALRQLHVERELAADQAAVGMTGRPASLASGLLKVIEGPAPAAATAALAPSGTLVDRVRYLVDERPPTGRMRSGVEITAVAAVLALAVGAAMQLPSMAAGSAGERDAMALVWSSVAEAAEDAEAEVEARAFQVYRGSTLQTDSGEHAPALTVDDEAGEVRRSTLHSCVEDDGTCPDDGRHRGLGIQPRPRIRVDESLVDRWRANPVVGSDDLGLYWLERRQE